MTDFDNEVELLKEKITCEKIKGVPQNIFSIKFEEFNHNDTRLIGLLSYSICDDLGIDWKLVLCYSDKKVYFYRRREKMKSNFTINIPYGTRNDYIAILYEINNLVSENSLFFIAVNNVPYCLEVRVVIETEENTEEILSIINKNELTIDNSQGYEEIFMETLKRKWSFYAFPQGLEFEEFCVIYSSLFVFKDKESIFKNGIDFNKNYKKKKLFISYSSSDSKLVSDVCNQFEAHGLNIWLDKKSINVGENILEAVSNGIRDCDLAILFISKATKEHLFANYELKKFFSDVIYKKKDWFIVKIDDTNLDDIIYGLNDFLYYDFKSNNNVEDLMISISNKIKSLSK